MRDKNSNSSNNDALAILCFRWKRPRTSIQEISKETGVPWSSVKRFLARSVLETRTYSQYVDLCKWSEKAFNPLWKGHGRVQIDTNQHDTLLRVAGEFGFQIQSLRNDIVVDYVGFDGGNYLENTGQSASLFWVWDGAPLTCRNPNCGHRAFFDEIRFEASCPECGWVLASTELTP